MDATSRSTPRDVTADAPPRIWLEASALAVSVAALYASGACPTVYIGDSGELVTAVATLGIPHPTGYPLYVLLGKLWTLVVPVGEVAWRLSLFAALCGGAAAGVLYAVIRHDGWPAVAALTGTLLFVAAPSVWGEANVQRVYTLNAFFLVLALRAAQSWVRRPTRGRLVRLFFVCGLGATNHVVMALVALAIVPWALWAHPAIRHPRHWPRALAAFGLGLLPYAYLPIRSRMDPVLDWGNPDTPRRLLAVLSRRDFWERAYLERWSDLGPILADWLGSFGTEITWAGVSLAALGAVAAWRSRLPALAFGVLAVNAASMALHGSRSDLFIWHRYYIPSYAMLAMLAGFGTGALVARLPRWARMLPLVFPVTMLVTGYRLFDRSHYAIADAFGRAVLRAVPPGATLIATDDNVLFGLIYLHHALGLRPDVDLVMEGVGGMTPPPLHFDPRRHAVFFTHHPNWQVPGLTIVPRGLVFQAWPAGVAPLPPLVTPETLPGEADARVPKDYLSRNLLAQFHYMRGVTAEADDWLRARAEFTAAAAASPDNDVLFYNLGLVFERAGLLDDARAAFERCHAINPRSLASHSRPRASDRLAEVDRERARLARLEAELRAADPVLAGLPAGSAGYHERVADALAARGETRAATGHRRLALEAATLDARAHAP
jgi:tetratricopeptide (TPR) repeat protein